jgi:integrase/recombinase XerD
MLKQTVQSYLEVRRACGFKLKSQGDLLRSFAAYSDARGKSHVCADTAIEWAGLARLAPRRARRLGEVIRFARYARAEDTRHEVPPTVFGSDQRIRRIPYIFSTDEVRHLVQAASQSGRETLRRYTYSTLFALLACTGLRVSEAIGLRYEDITPDGLVIRCSKFRRSRLIPLHDSARAGLERYLERRRSLESCPDERDHITKHMLALSTYLGHATVANTYWYLQATPALMSGIAERCERFVMEARP